jgi:flagellar biosynthesis protein FlhG
MADKADTHRKLMRTRLESSSFETPVSSRPARIVTIASGKGGVGKSCITANLGACLARSGLRVMIVDGDSGLANLDIMLDVQTQATLEQVLDGEARLQDAIVGIEPNLWLVPAASGLLELRQSSPSTREKLLSVFKQCPWEMDVILLDVGAGIQSNVLSLHHPVYESVIVVTPEPTSITDAYGLIKLLNRHVSVSEVSVIVNQVTDAKEARRIHQKLKDVADRFSNIGIKYLGHIPRDEKFTQSVLKRKILLDLEPGASAVAPIRLLAKQLCLQLFGEISESDKQAGQGLASLRSSRGAPGNVGNLGRFWTSLLGVQS